MLNRWLACAAWQAPQCCPPATASRQHRRRCVPATPAGAPAAAAAAARRWRRGGRKSGSSSGSSSSNSSGIPKHRRAAAASDSGSGSRDSSSVYGLPPELYTGLRARAGQQVALQQWLAEQGVDRTQAAQLAREHRELASCASPAATLGPKFELFKRQCSAEPGWASALVRAARAGDDGGCPVLLQPNTDFEAALLFLGAQLQRLSRRRFHQLNQPYSLYRFVQLEPEAAGGLLGRHPGRWGAAAAPWLRRQLGWGDAALADAALSVWYPELCQLDPGQAQACVEWLLQLGLGQAQAGQLLRGAPRLLVAPPAQLAAQKRRVAELAQAWGVGQPLAAALALAQADLSATRADLTGRLVKALRGTAGMSEQQLLLFALGDGLEGGCTRNPAALAAATHRLKQLLLVYGGWPDVAALVAQHPDALSMPWLGLAGLLTQPQQRQAWHMVAGMAAAAAAAAAEEGEG